MPSIERSIGGKQDPIHPKSPDKKLGTFVEGDESGGGGNAIEDWKLRQLTNAAILRIESMYRFLRTNDPREGQFRQDWMFLSEEEKEIARRNPTVQESVKSFLLASLSRGTRNTIFTEQLVREFPPSSEVMHSPEIKAAIAEFIEDDIGGDYHGSIQELQKILLFDLKDFQEIALKTIPQVLERGSLGSVHAVVELFQLSKESLQTLRISTAACHCLAEFFLARLFNRAKELIQFFSFTFDVFGIPEVRDAVRVGLIDALQISEVPDLRELKEIGVPVSILHEKLVLEAAMAAVFRILEWDHDEGALRIIENLSIPSDRVQGAALKKISEYIYESIHGADYRDKAVSIARYLSIPKEAFQREDFKSECLQAMSRCFWIKDYGLAEWINKEYVVTDREEEIFQFVTNTAVPDKIRNSQEMLIHCFTLPLDALDARRSHFLAPTEYADIKQRSPDTLKPDDKRRLRVADIITQLRETMVENKTDATLIEALDAGVAYFGPGPMLRYMNRPDLSRHDSLYFMTDVIALAERSGIGARGFATNILEQVAGDDSTYESGSAHHHFGFYVRNVLHANLDPKDPNSVFQRAKRYANILQMKELLQEFEDPKTGPFSSWKKLKKLDELIQLLERGEILEQLNAEKNPKMQTYVSSLAFHPGIAMDAVMKFWREPAAFLEVDDEHANETINAAKKPSNLLTLPHLGLTAEDARDALVGRVGEERSALDRIQVLPSEEKTYHLGSYEDPETTVVLHKYLCLGVGRVREGVKAKAPKLFAEVNKICIKENLELKSLIDPMSGVAALDALSPDVREEIRKLVFNPKIGMEPPEDQRQEYRVRLGLKSDPSMVVAGNDTASCMPFGSGKNNVYMFNPTCLQMIVERKTADGRWRTAAQSVVTLDYDTKQSTPELLKKYLEGNAPISSFISAEGLVQLPVVTCDNIEVAKNEEGGRVQMVEDVYKRFWKEYLESHAKDLGVDQRKVAIGTGYTPAEFSFRKQANTYIPAAPMGYSDNVHEECLMLDVAEGEQKPLEYPGMQGGLHPLTVRDVLATAYLEGKAYADNNTLLEYLHQIQNNIIGMQIANAYFDRPNFASLYRDPKGIPRGYLIAYEGVVGADRLPEVYIGDLAADPESKMAGGRLMIQFFQTYLESYVKKNVARLPPIYTNARDKTSYQILKNNLARMAERAGLKYEMVELSQYDRNGDLFHDVRIFFGRTSEELEEQKEVYGSMREDEAPRENWEDRAEQDEN